jgi:hypothetical protein
MKNTVAYLIKAWFTTNKVFIAGALVAAAAAALKYLKG